MPTLRHHHGMTIYLLRTAGWLTLLFVLPVALIRAQPYDDSELRAVLTPLDGCPAPCFMGIRPGVTTAEEAFEILKNHEWVAGISGTYSPPLVYNHDSEEFYLISTIDWQWNRTKPGWIKNEYGGTLWIAEGYVSRLRINTALSMGDFLLALDRPESIDINSTVTPTSGRMWQYDSWYSDRGILTSVFGFCPMRLSHLYPEPVMLYFRHLAPAVYGSRLYGATCKE